MNYVRRVLQPGEAVIHVTRIHPIIFLPAILWFAAAIVLFIAALTLSGDLRIAGQALAVFCLIFAIASALPALLRRISTELAVTDRRTGGSLEPIRMISDPLTFRSHITAG